jgi:dipeptidyl aminopeptidase/acylaminoacyl peptidase
VSQPLAVFENVTQSDCNRGKEPAHFRAMSYSWLRVWRVAPVVLSVVACGSDQGLANGGVTCGEGTVLQSGQCVVPTSDGGAAGNASQGGQSHGGSGGKDEAEAGTAGEGEADAGSAGATQEDAGSGFGGSSSGAGGFGLAGNGGSAGSGLAGSGGTAGTGGSGSVPGPNWLTVGKSDATFAYDLSKFPATSGLVSLETSSTFSPVWSPDGHWLMYQKSSEVYARDMRAAVPGPPLLLASSVGLGTALNFLTWSADSKTAAVAITQSTSPSAPITLQVFDPTHSAPLLHTLGSSVSSFSWAPVGDRVVFTDAGVTHVLRVESGVPGSDLILAGSGKFSFSPDGNSVACVSSNQLTLTDLTQTAPTPVALTNPSVSAPTVLQAVFSADGASMLFMGAQVRDGARDLFKVALKPAVGAPVRVSNGLTGAVTVGAFSTSPDGKWVVYGVTDPAGPSTSSWAVNLSGANPSTPVQVSAQPTSSNSWVHNGSERFLTLTSPGVSIVDVANAATSPLDGVSGSPSYLLSPVSALVAYGSSGGSHLYVRDLDHLETLASDILVGSELNSWRWSPDGKFLAVFDSSSPSKLRLIHLEGTTPTTAVPVTSGNLSTFTWQPIEH